MAKMARIARTGTFFYVETGDALIPGMKVKLTLFNKN